MPAHYTLRLQYGWHQDPAQIATRLVQLCHEAAVDEVMLFFFAEEMNNGHDTPEEIRRWISWSKPVTSALREAGVATTLNPWHSVLHVDRGRILKPSQANWQRMVDPQGQTATAVVCPLDPGWRAYYRQTIELYAQAEFDTIWIDDDIRYHNHGSLAWGGCFCPLHLGEFAKRIGLEVSREELVGACLAPGTPHPWRAVWMDLWDEQNTALLSEWRALVEPHGKCLGLMTSLPEQHAAEGRRWKSWFRALGGIPALHRPHFWPYTESFGSLLPATLNIMDQNRSLQPADVSSQPEIECIPYSQWNKSFRQIAAQMTVAQLFGASRLQFSIYDHMGNDPDDDPARATFLKAWHPALDHLSELFPATLRTQGIGVPWSEDMGRSIETAHGSSWEELVCPSRGWANWLGAAGLATSVHADSEVTAVGGPVVHSFDDEQIKSWLQRGLLLDAYAARILASRGFGAQIGIDQLTPLTQENRPFAVEACTHPDFTFRPEALISVNSEFFTPYGQKLLQGELAAGAFEITELRGPRQEKMGHGITGFVNEWGGRVAVTPWEAETPVHMNSLRADQLARLTTFLAGGKACLRVSGGAWLVPLMMSNQTSWRLAIWNGSNDAIAKVTVHGTIPWQSLEYAFLLRATGERIDVTATGPEIELPAPMGAWECLVLAGSSAG